MEKTGYLNSFKKEECFGCEACVQKCPKQAIAMQNDDEKFRYPVVDTDKCIGCGLCHAVCPYENMPERFSQDKLAFGGYIKDHSVRADSTSGGAFSAIVKGWCDENYAFFGATADGLEVYHTYSFDINRLKMFRKSKYSQSKIGSAYEDASKFLSQGKKVLFSGTPCQIAGLKKFLGNQPQTKLLTVEVICEGVPTPLFTDRYSQWLEKAHKSKIRELDYRFKSAHFTENRIHGKWDFEVMRTELDSGKTITKDRWFNPFWSIWLNHLMSRPCCYECPFASTERAADISLGDLWGVHIYCPELYGHNAGASLVVCNTDKGKAAFRCAEGLMYGHELDFGTALKYQSPMRKHIDFNPERSRFMEDVKIMDYKALCKKWAEPPTKKLLWQKYIWGNRQKVWFHNLLNGKKG